MRVKATAGCLTITTLAIAMGIVLLPGCAPPSRTAPLQLVPGTAGSAPLRVTLRARTENRPGRKWTEADMEITRQVLERRLRTILDAQPTSRAGADTSDAHIGKHASLSVPEFKVTTKLPDRMILDLPQVANEQKTLQHLTMTRDLRFYLLPQLGNDPSGRRGRWSVDLDKGTREEFLVNTGTGKRLTPQELDAQVLGKRDALLVVTGAQLLPQCKPQILPTGGICISFEFDAEGTRALEEVTRTHPGEHLGVFVDNQLLTAPSIQGVIGGKGILEGPNFTRESAKRLADEWNAGALPVPLEIVKVEHPPATVH